MKKTTIAICKETKDEIQFLMTWLNVLLDARTRHSTKCYFGQAESIDDLILNYALPALRTEIKQGLSCYEEFKHIVDEVL